MVKYHIEKNTVQETLVIPLFGRLVCSERFPQLFSDPEAARICACLDYDFADKRKKMESPAGLFGALEVAQRQYDLRCEVDAYLKEHPKAAVVNLGCGLDDTFSKVDNGLCRGYNLDFADVIAVRSELLPAGERETNIACDLNDFSWMDEVDGADGAIFFAAGVFHYFTEAQARALVNALAARFPGCRIVFDVIGKLGKVLMKKTFKNFGMENYDECLFVEDPATLDGWCPAATVSTRGYMLGYRKMDDPNVTGLHRALAWVCDNVVKMRIVRMDCS